MAVPLLIVNIKPGEWLADFQGTYQAGATYQAGQMVKEGENVWSCLKKTTGNTPEEGSPYWGFLGNALTAVGTYVEEEAEAAEQRAIASAKVNSGWRRTAPAPKLEVRNESALSVARIQGGVTMKAGKEVAANAQLFVLPVGYRPTATVVVAATDSLKTIRQVTITSAGVVSLSTALKTVETVDLDGITFSTT
jgi:hypothetical protein